jgi:hypothetical protein
VRINRKVQEFYEVLDNESKKITTIQERELELLPEAYAEITEMPIVEAILVEAIPSAIQIIDNPDTSDF